MRGESVAVVSSNNSATENVFAKLKKYGVDFIADPLGSTNNKMQFLSEQTTPLPYMSLWGDEPNNFLISRMIIELDSKLELKNELFSLLSEEDALIKEKIHFDDYYKTLTIDFLMPKFSEKIAANQILEFATEYEYLLSKKK